MQHCQSRLLKLRRGRAITPRVAARRPDPLPRLLVLLLYDELAFAKVDAIVSLVHLDLVAHRAQLLDDSIGDTMLERHGPIPPLDIADVVGLTAAHEEAWRVQRGLRMVSVVNQVAELSQCYCMSKRQGSHEDLEMALGLHVSAHHAVGRHELLALRNHGRF